MAVLLDAQQIIDGGTVENERVEYKKGWNPEDIMHAVCAFANDIEGQNGGYIIIGIREENGRPAEIIGVSPNSIDGMNAKLLDLCRRIDPHYIASSQAFPYHNKTLFVIYAPGGDSRPYNCPISLSEKKSERAYYIRKLGRTIRADSNEVKILYDLSRIVPFEDRMNPDARLSDISASLIREFLSSIGSRYYDRSMDMNLPALAEQLGLLHKADPEPRPINLALMLFNNHPEDFFPYSWIEIVYKPDPTGMGMREHKIRGPVDRQIRDALSVIENNYITEYVTKRNDRAEAIREYNYPLEAVREAVVNAIYHRGYDSEQPVTVYIMQDRMEITSAPGPDPSISDADLKEGHLLTRYNRNRRLGEFLKDLNLAEGRGTGIPLMQEFMDRNGSDPPVFETDSKRSYMTVILPVNSRFLPEGRTSKGSPVPKSKEEATFDTIVSLLKTNGPMSTREIATAMGYDMPPTSLRTALKYMMLSGRIRYLYPNSPHAGRQKIVLVEDDRFPPTRRNKRVHTVT